MFMTKILSSMSGDAVRCGDGVMSVFIQNQQDYGRHTWKVYLWGWRYSGGMETSPFTEVIGVSTVVVISRSLPDRDLELETDADRAPFNFGLRSPSDFEGSASESSASADRGGAKANDSWFLA